MNGNTGIVPNLRFPEFLNAGEWDAKQLKDACLMQAAKFVKAAEIHEKSKDEFYPCYGGNGLRGFTQTFTHTGKFSLIGRQGALCGNVNLATGKFHATEHAVVTTPKEGVDTNWFFYMLGYLNLNQYATGQAQPGLSVENLEKVLINIPKKEKEQQKIADCLSSLDELITAQTQKLDGLKTHKKGLMQQLFPAEGETLPKLRFPEFRDAGEWEEKTLGQVADYENGKAHEQDISASGKFLVVNSKFISTEGDVRKFTDTGYCLAEKEDILMVLSDVPNGRAIAKCFFVDSDNLYTVNQRICKIKPKKAVSIMLFYILNRNSYFLAFDDGVKQTNLKKDDVLSCPILLPHDIKEQQKIADCLSSIDELITAQTQKLDGLKTHKKGLMQQLFPSADEVAG